MTNDLIYVCPWPGCSATFTRWSEIAAHVRNVHHAEMLIYDYDREMA